ncbi:MAG TPA: HNH endonuclease signature motif containing protein [Beutenbergiaceae bacterium]|nr:HNH endonuclease signature motif containing protein [Beutenbergiaceae bacterium]
MYTDASPAITNVEDVLDGVAGVREQLRLLDRGLVVLAVEWAKHHPTDPYPPDHPGFEGMEDQWVFDQLSAKGCLAFDDDSITEFAIAAGLTEHTARKLVRESLMLVHLLPRVWSRVLAGGLDVWRARLLAGDCFDLTPAAVDFIDRHMSERTARITQTSRDRIVAEARKRFMAEAEETEDDQAKSMRAVEVYTNEHHRGIVPVLGHMDLPDALALDAALTAGAQALKDAGSDAPLGTRRAWALGDLARSATGHGTLFSDSFADGGAVLSPEPADLPKGTWVPADLADTVPPTEPAPRPFWNGKGASPPGVKLFIHLPHSAVSEPSRGVAAVEGKGVPGPIVCDPRTIREWFTRPTLTGAFAPEVNVRPVLDLEESINSDAYQPPRRAREHVQLSHDTCAFPFCTRRAHQCDTDHTEPWKPDGTGGATCTCNLAPLCRTHHRLKTHADNSPVTSGKHSAWSYVHLGDAEYYWTGPRGMQFIRTNAGTYSARTERNDGAPAHPGAQLANAPAAPVDLGDNEDRERAEDLIEALLAKSASTRAVHGRDYPPSWTVPEPSPFSLPPEADPFIDEEDPGCSIAFFIPYHPPPGTPEWKLANRGAAA